MNTRYPWMLAAACSLASLSGYGAHGDNERVEEQAFIDMVRYMWNVVIEVAATQ